MNPAPPHPPNSVSLLQRLRAGRARIPATRTLMLVNLLVFIAMVWHGAGLWHASGGLPLAWGANFGPATKDGEWWRLGSALFLHFGLFHLAMNLLSLWDSGRLVERIYGPARFLLIYFSAGLLGNLFSLYAQGEEAISAGASGAIFGVYGALISYLWLARRELDPREFRYFFGGAVLFAAVAIGVGILVEGIDNHAHGGGLAGGLLAGLVLAPASVVPRRLVPRAALAAYTLAVVVMLVTMPQPRYRWSEEQHARQEIQAFLGAERHRHAQLADILSRAQHGETSFDQLAGLIESEIAQPYDISFEHLARLHLDPVAPSAPALAALLHYTERQRNAARALAEQLRARDKNTKPGDQDAP